MGRRYSGSVPPDLTDAAQRLIEAAHAYWVAFNRDVTRGSPAVVWLQDDSGAMVTFTRGEYSESLREFIAELDGEPDDRTGAPGDLSPPASEDSAPRKI